MAFSCRDHIRARFTSPLLILPFMFTIIGLVLTWIVVFSCSMFRATRPYWYKSLGVGLYAVEEMASGVNVPYFNADYEDDQYDVQCVLWGRQSKLGDHDVDEPIQFARVIAGFALVFSTSILIMLILTSCMFIKRSTFNIDMIFAFMTCQMLFMLLMIACMLSKICKQAESCKIGRSSVVSIVGAAVWAMGAATVHRAYAGTIVSEDGVATTTATVDREYANRVARERDTFLSDPSTPACPTLARHVVHEQQSRLPDSSALENTGNGDGGTQDDQNSTASSKPVPIIACIAVESQSDTQGPTDGDEECGWLERRGSRSPPLPILTSVHFTVEAASPEDLEAIFNHSASPTNSERPRLPPGE